MRSSLQRLFGLLIAEIWRPCIFSYAYWSLPFTAVIRSCIVRTAASSLFLGVRLIFFNAFCRLWSPLLALPDCGIVLSLDFLMVNQLMKANFESRFRALKLPKMSCYSDITCSFTDKMELFNIVQFLPMPLRRRPTSAA